MAIIVRYGIIIALVLIAGTNNGKAQTQEAIAVLEKLQRAYTKESGYDIKMTYTMYRGYTGSKVTEKYNGTLYKKGNTFIMKALDMEALQFPEGQLRIDHKSKNIYYVKQSGKIENPTDISKILQFYKPVSLVNRQGIDIIEMNVKSRQLQIPFQKVILHILKEKNTLLKQELYFAQKMPFITNEGKEEYDTARVEIELEDNTDTKSIRQKKLSDYVIRQGNQLMLTDIYSTYTLIDQTNP
ncbi:hypothetical protein [Aquimarina macrocephali]|uniref:hypothetical protein n=1 Tax=Aquimarina macrocephali TaxID=666563 RepID=UPI000467612A|nr:hypothetical protein [Aquimarina macrocephali]